MDFTPDILVVAEEALIRAELESLLGILGYDVEALDNFPNVDEFQASGQYPDLLLVQVNEATLDVAEKFVKAVSEFRRIPCIFLTDSKDEVLFSRLKELRPFGFLAKPLDFGGIRRIIELALVYDTAQPQNVIVNQVNGTFVSAAPTYFFTKVGNKLKRITISKVLYVEVEGKYSSIQLQDRKFNVKASLKDLLEKFPADKFVRVSRNYLINLEFIEHIDTVQYMVKVDDKEIPVSRTYKEELMSRISLL